MKKFLIILSIGFVFSCAHHKDGRPGADGIHRVVVTTDDKEEGSRNAIDQANDYCKESKKSAAIVTKNKNMSAIWMRKTIKPEKN